MRGDDYLGCGNAWSIDTPFTTVWLRKRDGEWITVLKAITKPRATGQTSVRLGQANSGCEYPRVQTKAKTRGMTHRLTIMARPLAACRSDPALKGTASGRETAPREEHARGTTRRDTPA